MVDMPVGGSLQPVLYSLVVMCALACGLLGGAIFSVLARPNQLRHASLFAGAVALVSFAKDAILRFVQPENPTILTLEGLWVLPFVVAALACAAISRAGALERKQKQPPGAEV
jgi:hypothetical protein